MSHPDIRGTVAAGFELVRDAFRQIVIAENQLEAQFAVYHRGELVVDLWTGPAVERETLLGVFSVSKGAAHLVIALLVQDGLIDLDKRVSHYWPEFAVEGKGDLLVRDLLAHRSGLVGSHDGFSIDQLADDQVVASRLAAQRPFWRPGAAFAYHALVAAALTGEVVRRVTGRSVQELLTDRLTQARDIDFHFGLPAERDGRYLPAQPARPTPEQQAAIARSATGPDSIPGIAFNRHAPNNPEVWELPNFEVVRRAGTASFGAVASARGAAKLYAAAIGEIDGEPALLTPDTMRAVSQVHSIGYDMVTRDHKAFTAGFHAVAEYYPALGAGTFGHSGVGGQMAFADPRHSLAFGYARRRLAVQSVAAADIGSLIAPLMAAIGHR